MTMVKVSEVNEWGYKVSHVLHVILLKLLVYYYYVFGTYLFVIIILCYKIYALWLFLKINYGKYIIYVQSTCQSCG